MSHFLQEMTLESGHRERIGLNCILIQQETLESETSYLEKSSSRHYLVRGTTGPGCW